MPISDPRQLVAEFKKSGEFDRLRRELLADSQRSNGFEPFKARLEEIAQEYISGQTAHTNSTTTDIHKKLIQEVNRFPVVERFASEVPMLSELPMRIRASLQRILGEDRGEQHPLPTPSAPSQEHIAPSQPSVPPPADLFMKETEESPVRSSQEAPVGALVPRESLPEAPDGKDVDMIDPAPLTAAPETSM
ncbi:hypothetical protein C8R43DRAFT_990750 [Mycena crocata]|nr:hypothetical protein C8R43DRAFT_990750 [Mycena crocata]